MGGLVVAQSRCVEEDEDDADEDADHEGAHSSYRGHGAQAEDPDRWRGGVYSVPSRVWAVIVD